MTTTTDARDARNRWRELRARYCGRRRTREGKPGFRTEGLNPMQVLGWSGRHLPLSACNTPTIYWQQGRRLRAAYEWAADLNPTLRTPLDSDRPRWVPKQPPDDFAMGDMGDWND